MLRGRRGRGAAPGPRRNLQARISNLNNQLRGTKFSPPPFPRLFTVVPWNSLTVEFEQAVTDTASATLEITANSIRSKIQEIVGSSSKFKAIKFEAWCTATGLSYPTLKAEFFDIVEQVVENPEARSQQSDRGTLNMPAKAGFLLPMSDQKRVLSSEDNAYKLCKVSTGGAETGMVLLVRVHVLWQYYAASF